MSTKYGGWCGGLKVIGNKSSNKKRQQCTVIVVFPLFDNMMRAKRTLFSLKF